MKLKKMIVCITKSDIRNFLKLQNKINISDIFINDDLRLLGSVNILGMNVNIEAELSFSKVECNNIYINIKSFKVLKMNIVNPISKKVFNYVINAFTDIEGVTFEENDFKLEVTTLINKYYKEQKFIDLNKVQVIDVSIVDKEVEVYFGGIDIDTEVIRREYGKNEVPYVEAEIVSDGE
ncbi:hypothetical protein [uncultured Clostridium sp.]|uniref:hypothetical protein n=1 Tax=uncultured Clostridium sp. TaxID=59620 RepID=UPI0025CEA18A|nr:hypothetical protein [uncultured Clostridium sp.]